jgi:hypothetical protein
MFSVRKVYLLGLMYVASHNFPFWNCLGKRCAALPFVYVASHTALAGALHSIFPGSPKTGSY